MVILVTFYTHRHQSVCALQARRGPSLHLKHTGRLPVHEPGEGRVGLGLVHATAQRHQLAYPHQGVAVPYLQLGAPPGHLLAHRGIIFFNLRKTSNFITHTYTNNNNNFIKYEV